MNDRSDIFYREFFDVPRLFIVSDQNTSYLFDGRFDEAIDDYPEQYDVFAFPRLNVHQLPQSWLSLRETAIAPLGRVPVAVVDFDPSRRQSIGTELVRTMATRLAKVTRSAAAHLQHKQAIA